MAQAFVGKFKLASQENFDEYMKAIGTHIQSLLARYNPLVLLVINVRFAFEFV